MFPLNIPIFVTFFGFIVTINSGSVKNWKYTLDKIECNSTDENVFKSTLRPVRVSPGVYAVNGTMKLGIDIDDQTTMSVRLLRSASGTSLYQLTPYSSGNIPFSVFMNKIYKPMLMDDVVKCSNLPRFEQYSGIFPSGEYFANLCVVSTEGMPSQMSPGTYKVIVEAFGKGERVVAVVTTQVTLV